MITFNLQTLCAFKGPGATQQSCQKGAQKGELFIPTLEVVRNITFDKLDTDAWMDAAASFGARYAVLVGQHMAGFALWPSNAKNVTIATTKWLNGRGDVMADFLKSCASRNIAPGFFYSTHFDWIAGVNEYKVGHPRVYGGPSLTQQQYEDLVLAELSELAARYRTADNTSSLWQEVWFDGGVDNTLTPRVGPLVRQLFPNATCHSCFGFTQASAAANDGRGLRWMGNEEGSMPLPSWGAYNVGLSPYNGDPQGAIFSPPSCDTVLYEHYWFWQQEETPHIRSTCELVSVYLTSVGRASNLILNMAPDNTGGLPAADVAAYSAMGKAIACLWSLPLADMSGPFVLSDDGSSSSNNNNNNNNNNGTVDIDLPAAVAASAAGTWNLSLHLQENMTSTGQRIGEWQVSVRIVNGSSSSSSNVSRDGVKRGGNVSNGNGNGDGDGEWVQVFTTWPTSTTTAIGHKRIMKISLAHYSPTASITGLRFTALTAYTWLNVTVPLTLSRVALYDWQYTQSCLPSGCELPQW